MLKLGQWFFRYRDYTPIPIILLLFIIAEFNPVYFFTGISLTVIGELIRIIAVAYIGGISRTRKGTVDNLVTSGPFSRLRNPLYAGNFLLSLGLSCLSGVWWFLILYLFLFWIQYIPIVAWEEALLEKKFGEEYLNYKKAVPRFFPKLGKAGVSQGEYNFKKALKSERSTLSTVIIIYFIICTKFFFWNQLTEWVRQ